MSSGSRGLSMLELIVALSLMALAASGLLGLARVATRAAQIIEGRFEAQQNARRAIDRVIEELRWAEAVVPDAGCAPAGLCPDRVRARIPSGNPYRQDLAYEVVFQHNPRQREIERRVGRGVNNLASAVDRVEITYLEAGGVPATTAADVARIRVALVVRPRGGPEAIIESEVALRNRRVAEPAPPSPTPVWRPTPRGPDAPFPRDRIAPRVPPGPSRPR